MTIYTLYIKTHRKTGLKYFGQTKQNPFKYNGSGADWKTHLREHGVEHTTEIIRECYSKKELSIWGRYYSKLWNVVGAMDNYGNKIWANKILETGGGPGFTSEQRKVYSNTAEAKQKFIESVHSDAARIKSVNTRNATISTQEWKFKFKKTMNEWRSSLTDEQIAKTHEKRLSTVRSAAGRKRNSDAQKIAQNRPDVVKKKSQIQSIVQNKPEVKEKKSGSNNYRYDKTIRNFYHTNGAKISCTAGELAKKFKLDRHCVTRIVTGLSPQVKGWRVELVSS